MSFPPGVEHHSCDATYQAGTPRVDDRRVLNGIFWVLRSALPGGISHPIDVPERLVTIVSFAGEGPASRGTASCRR